ncbi:MAG TPA: MFS transporter, partial [Acidobacteriaceae bacterium]|nr:MFS transporter [Acidobacteriaceae bacterium]
MTEIRAPKGNTTTIEEPQNPGLSRAWRALRHRNFRLFFGGQSISLIGSWMTRLATSWLVYRLT